jgi:hypothetical protein
MDGAHFSLGITVDQGRNCYPAKTTLPWSIQKASFVAVNNGDHCKRVEKGHVIFIAWSFMPTQEHSGAVHLNHD